MCGRAAVGREALESSSAALQAAAKPSQLPARIDGREYVARTKKPDVFVTPGFLEIKSSRVSQAQGMRERNIRRLIGETAFAFGFGYVSGR